ncbi:MAG TPA: hypothetical protein VEA61_01300 [Allosphingosinicella sp.]|nr:hypothetical protein [Allosphingosinicella sp.]
MRSGCHAGLEPDGSEIFCGRICRLDERSGGGTELHRNQEAFVDRWDSWDEALHGTVAANIRAQQRCRFRLFEYGVLGVPQH